MRTKYENKTFYILLRENKKIVHEGIMEEKTKKAIEKKVLLSKRQLRKNPWIELKNIDAEGNYNNTCQRINMNYIGIVEILESKEEYLEYKKEEIEAYLSEVAIHQVENHLLVEMDKCNLARITAIKENKVNSEVKMWGDMQDIYGLLVKHLETLK